MKNKGKFESNWLKIMVKGRKNYPLILLVNKKEIQ